MKALIISDLHLTDSPLEQYRWNVFNWTKTQLSERDVDALFILGDIFDRKDRHPASIVNQLATILTNLAQQCPTFILKGNHDYLNPANPFLGFLNLLPNITWIAEPSQFPFGKKQSLWLPHSKDPVNEWEPVLAQAKPDIVFMHQSVIGSKTSNAYEMNCGLDLAWLEKKVHCPIISGDIHVPQVIGSLTYVGTQHPVSFGDDYTYRALLLNFDTLKYESLIVPSLKRHAITMDSLTELQRLWDKGVLQEGDHVKIKIVLSPQNLSEWATLKLKATHWCAVHKIEVFDIKLEKDVFGEVTNNKDSKKTGFIPVHPTTTFNRFTKQEAIDPKIIAVGQQILDEVLNAH